MQYLITLIYKKYILKTKTYTFIRTITAPPISEKNALHTRATPIKLHEWKQLVFNVNRKTWFCFNMNSLKEIQKKIIIKCVLIVEQTGYM